MQILNDEIQKGVLYMKMNSPIPDLNGLIQYLNYHGPVFIRLKSDLESHLLQTASVVATQDTP